jgi:hypothetical protein
MKKNQLLARIKRFCVKTVPHVRILRSVASLGSSAFARQDGLAIFVKKVVVLKVFYSIFTLKMLTLFF